MFRSILSCASVAIVGVVFAVWTVPPAPADTPDDELAAVPVVMVPFPDLARVQAEDEERAALGLAPRFAIPNEVLISPATDGVWKDLDERTRQWRLRITSPGALSLNLGFTAYFMPPGGQLWLYATDGSYALEPYTDFHNADHGELWTAVVLADDILVEVTLPAAVEKELILHLTSINVGYRGFGETQADKAGACNIDVICPVADAWRNEIPAIGVISTGGSLFCTGFMVNNTAQDQTPYFMTAYHCGVTSSNAASLVVYWNFYSPTCGQHGGGSLSQYQSGSTWRAGWSTSDFTLVQLSQMPNPAWGITYAGWDRRDVNATSAVGIHHPNCDEKSISFTETDTIVTSYLSNSSPGNGTHLRVVWETSPNRGVTEPGSSGSPIFDQNHRVLGQLHGGYSACNSSDMRDWYGRFYRSWTGGGTNTTRLSNWLDPGNTGLEYVDTLVPCTLPSITSHPASQTKCAGQSVTFTVSASGTGLSYQWRKNSTNISGATGSSYSITSVTTADAGSYDCVVTNSCGSVTSNAATLTVNTAPTITAHPASQIKCVGQSVTFSVSASGTSLSYQWRKNSTNISGATGSSYTISSVTTADAGSYDCVVTNSCGSVTSNAATLTVNTAPTITAHPASQTKCVGQSVTFSVSASGTGLSYQWRKNSTNISGATGSSYTISSVTTADAGSYDCVVTNSCGSVTSNAATLTVNTAPTITAHPASQTRCVGQSVTFSVSASGTGLSYQWRKNSTNISGATGSSYTISSVTTADAGSYDCVVTNSCGSVTSNAATLTVDTGPAITGHPQSQVVNVGQPVAFTVSATGAGLTYQWRKNGTNISGATSSSYAISSVTTADAGSYSCLVSNTCGSVESQTATLTVTQHGDMNCDGEVTFADIDLFVEALQGQSSWSHPECPWLNADLNGDGEVTYADIDPFVALLGSAPGME
jgi:hypothetical protein